MNYNLSGQRIHKIIKEEIINLKNNFIVGNCYEYDDLSETIQEDIDVQFKVFDEEPETTSDKYDGFPEDYKYCFKYLKPKQLKTYFPLIDDILYYLKKFDGFQDDYTNQILNDIKTSGLKYPPVGSEGNHRATAFFLLNKEMPYLEINEK